MTNAHLSINRISFAKEDYLFLSLVQKVLIEKLELFKSKRLLSLLVLLYAFSTNFYYTKIFNNIKLIIPSLKIGIVSVGSVDNRIIEKIQHALSNVIPYSEVIISKNRKKIPKKAHNPFREQYRSQEFLSLISNNFDSFDKVLGITDVDIYPLNLKYAFGEAQFQGRAAIMSIYRLKPDFYNERHDFNLLVERSVKEAIHEIAHTFGLKHCQDSKCVMFFSNSIFETDRKKNTFCTKCYNNLHNLRVNTP